MYDIFDWLKEQLESYYSLDEDDIKKVFGFFNSDTWDDIDEIDIEEFCDKNDLSEIENIIDFTRECCRNAEEYEWIPFLRNNYNRLYDFGDEACESWLWNAGKCIHQRYFICMYALLVCGEKLLREKENKILKKKILGLLVAGVLTASTLTGCGTEAEKVNYNLTQQADNFNVVRQLTVINCIEGDVLFQMTGKMSITADTADNQLEIIVEDGGTYVKHFVGLSDNVTYVVEDLNLGANAVSKYKYTLNFNPNMWIPVNVETID